METRRKMPWSGIVFLVFLIGHQVHLAHCADLFDGPAKGDNEAYGSEPAGNANLGFDDVLRRHDGYVKGETPTIPQTSFTCAAQPYSSGLYADMETNCQVYHVCHEGRQESFLCGPGTNFNQKILACDFWYNFDCQDSASFYSANAEIGKTPETGVYRPSPSIRGTQQTERPSFPSYPQPAPRPVSSGGYVPPPPPPPPVSRQPPPPPPRPQQPRVPQQPQLPRVPQQPYTPRVPQQPPRIPQPSAQPPRVEQPEPPILTIEEHLNTGYEPQRPVVIVQTGHQRPYAPTTPRPVFPPVVSPPRVTRPPVQHPVVVRRPAESAPPPRRPSRPATPQQPIHPDSEFKGTGYRPPRPEPPRIPQPSQPVDQGFPSYPSRPIVQEPVRHVGGRRPQPPPELQQEHVDVSYVPPPAPRQPPPPPPAPKRPPPPPPAPKRPPPPPPAPRQPPPPPPAPKRPPPPPPAPRRPPPPPPAPRQPPPPPPPRRQPPPPRPVQIPVQQEVVEVKPDYVRPPAPSQVTGEYVPPPPPSPPRRPVAPRPPSPPVAPSVISTQQRRPSPPPSRPQVVSRPRQPQRPVFPPSSDHPNANVKGGPRYRQPPPSQLPSYEPTRINHRPSGSTSQVGYQRPPPPPRPAVDVYEPIQPVKRPSQTILNPGYKPPQTPPRATGSGYVPPPPPPTPVPDHPDSGIKGSGYVPPVPRQPVRVISPATKVTSVKRPQSSGSSYPDPKPLPPSGVKVTSPSTGNEIKRPPAPGRVKLPSQTTEQKVPGQTVRVPQRQVFPSPRPRPVDHPNANVKGGPGYRRSRPQAQQPVRVSQPSEPIAPAPPSAPSTTVAKKTPPSQQVQGQARGRGRPAQKPYKPLGDDDRYEQELVKQEVYEPQRRRPLPPPIAAVAENEPKEPTVSRGVKRPAASQRVKVKQPNQDYGNGDTYKRGPEQYPKPEFQQSLVPVSTPSRSSSIKQPSASQTKLLSEGSPGSSSTAVHGGRYPQASASGGDSPSSSRVPGHQPAGRRQVFPHRDNPDHPNASIKGTNAYRPPPPANYEAAASEIQEKKAETGAKQDDSKLGDTGTE